MPTTRRSSVNSSVVSRRSRTRSPSPGRSRSIRRTQVYYEQCSEHGVTPNSAVSLALANRAAVIDFGPDFAQAGLLPLVETLRGNEHVRELDFSRCFNVGSMGCLALRDLLLSNSTLARINLSWNHVNATGAKALAEGLAGNHSLKELILRGNSIGRAGVAELAAVLNRGGVLDEEMLSRRCPHHVVLEKPGRVHMVLDGEDEYETSSDEESSEVFARRAAASAFARGATPEAMSDDEEGAPARVNYSLTHLDVSNNVTGYSGLLPILRIAEFSSLVVEAEGNYYMEEILNSATHGIGFIITLIGAYLLCNIARDDSWTMLISCIIYSVSLSLTYISSTLCHAFFMMYTTSRVFQVLDHASIYLLIAGTYTPFMAVNLGDTLVGRTVLTVIWCIAIGGVGVSITGWMSHISHYFYLGMGFLVVTCFPTVVECVDTEGVILMIAGGASYAVGTIFFLKGKTQPSMHVVWHIFVIIGSFIHYIAIYHYVVLDTERQCAANVLAAENAAAAAVADIAQNDLVW